MALNGSHDALQGAVAASGAQIQDLRAAVGGAAKGLQVAAVRTQIVCIEI